MTRDFSIYLKDILENIELIEKFTKNTDYHEFTENHMINHAVLRCIEIIGEAVKNIPEPIRKKYPQIPWRDIAGMRDKIIHFYFGINLETVWLVVIEDLPKIKTLIKKALADYKKS